jgi:hypothetical protein
MNEIIDKAKETDDLLLLIEQHKKEIWEWKQKESKWLEDKVLLDGTKKLVNKLSEELTAMKEINENHQSHNGKLQVELTEAKEDNKKLAHQIEDKVNTMRKSGM